MQIEQTTIAAHNDSFLTQHNRQFTFAAEAIPGIENEYN